MGLIAHYRLAGNANDAIGENHATVNGGVTWVAGKLGIAADFDGSTGYIADSRISDYLHGKPEASIALWVKKDAIQYGFLQLSGYANSNGNLYPYQTETAVYLDIFRTDRLGPIELPTSTLEWHHIAITQTAGKWCLYQNGVLVHTAGAADLVSTDYLQFEIGRNSGNRYADGKFQDVRIYDHALSVREVRNLALGNVLDLRFTEEDDLTDASGHASHAAAYIGAPIWNAGKLEFNGTDALIINTADALNFTDDGFTFWFRAAATAGITGNLRLFNRGEYLVEGYDLFFSANTITLRCYTPGQNEASLGTGSFDPLTLADYMVVKQPGTGAQIYRNGQLIGDFPSMPSPLPSTHAFRLGCYFTDSYFFSGELQFIRAFATALTAAQAAELYKAQATIDARGSLHVPRLLEEALKPLFLDYTTWEAGQTGSVGQFERSGKDTENHRVLGNDPWGKETVLWEAQPDGGNDANGGFNTGLVPIDNTKLYRFSTWVKRNSNNDGGFYLGANGGVFERTTGLVNNNPYFWTNITSFVPGVWYIVVGHVWPVGSGTGVNHPDSGVYTTSGEKLADIGTDYVWDTAHTHTKMRSYLHYGSNIAQRQWWAYPRIDLIDAFAPSLAELLAGHDSRSIEYRRAKGGSYSSALDISKAVTHTGRLSEIGPAEGLVAWYPLVSDTQDYAGNLHGINYGAVLTAEGYEFAANDDKIIAGNLRDVLGTYCTEITLVARVKKYAHNNTYDMVLGQNLPYFAMRNSGPTVSLSIGDQQTLGSSVTVNLNQWYTIAATYDGQAMKVYQDGVLTNSAAMSGEMWIKNQNFTIGDGQETTWYPMLGCIKDVRVYNRALSAKECALLYNHQLTANRLQKTADALYLANPIKEVLS